MMTSAEVVETSVNINDKRTTLIRTIKLFHKLVNNTINNSHLISDNKLCTSHMYITSWLIDLSGQSPAGQRSQILKIYNPPIHLTLKMTSAKVVETSVNINDNSFFFLNYTHPDCHTIDKPVNKTK